MEEAQKTATNSSLRICGTRDSIRARAERHQAIQKQKMHRFKDPLAQEKRVADAQSLANFTRGDARVGGHTVVMIEAGFGTPRRNMRAAVIAEDFLEAGNDLSSARIARGNRAARARIAAFEIHFADAEAHRAAFFFAEELILPERGDAVDFERGAEALADFVEVHAAKQIANSLQARGGNNRWAIGDIVVRKAFWRMT